MVTNNFIKEKLTQKLLKMDTKDTFAGVLIQCIKTKKVLLLLRNDTNPIWSMVSGTIESGETIIEGLKREIYEELYKESNDIEFKFIGIEEGPNDNFHYFEGFTNDEFIPILNDENLKFGWFLRDNLPKPLYNGLTEKIANI